ncbi:sigma-70 family RNA polymerase sigma factor [Flavilitoribacter nigricans]|uniref:RNA polymerase subunit sigma n=1 Tax=Flavilitoribacter nigricans (strain ATCC 23147 / DSM 23189 / NBRC 102662 / NCIMB 1420 / SS-2) TaxID=1122177 RepID=A0A2D0N6B6_FLAN2|nr:RNA polymerase sigma factor RpoD/SigA [Flavilitoribacter nigricans]PHN04072.1 RNA polymerase subunit sigma [Flavilitoribacter nigricans DSM 23189 = NBRC 102662]
MRALVITHNITRRDSMSIEKYLNEVSKYDVLTPEEELRLFRRFKDGDEAAFQKIIRSNLRFVISVAKQYQHTGLSLDDLINEGNIGLIKAAQRFDETRGFKFISYAVWWIRQSILQAIGEKSKKIRLPANYQSRIQEVVRTRNELYQELEREPSLAEIAAVTDLKESDIENCLRDVKYCKSLNEPVGEDEDSASLEEMLADAVLPSPDSDLVGTESLRIELTELLGSLSAREAEILSMYFGLNRKQPLSLQDISDYLDLSRERVRQIKDRALRKLKRKIFNEGMVFSVN